MDQDRYCELLNRTFPQSTQPLSVDEQKELNWHHRQINLYYKRRDYNMNTSPPGSTGLLMGIDKKSDDTWVAAVWTNVGDRNIPLDEWYKDWILD